MSKKVRIPRFLGAVLRKEEVELKYVAAAAAGFVAAAALLGVGGRAVVVHNTASTCVTAPAPTVPQPGDRGPDISSYQSVSQSWFANLKANGFKFVIIRAGGADDPTYGMYQDRMFQTYWNWAAQYGLARLAYYFDDPSRASATTEANALVSIVNGVSGYCGFQPGTGVMLDDESGASGGAGWANTFLSTAHNGCGCPATFYSDEGYMASNGLEGNLTLSSYPLDLAYWASYVPAPPPSWSKITIQQYTDGGEVEGIPMDVNRLLSGWPGKATPAPAPSSSPPPSSGPTDLYRDAALYNATDGYTLDCWGGIHPVGNAPVASGYGYWPGWCIAHSLAVLSGGAGGIQLDGWGGLHPFNIGGVTPTVANGPYWSGWDIARGLSLGTRGGYVLDGWGGLHAIAVDGVSAPQPQLTAYWSGWDIARDVVEIPGTDEGYVLDGWGGLHPFNGAPAVTVSAYWSGWDIARSVVINSGAGGCVNGYVLDGWGGIHPFEQSGCAAPPTPTHQGYWSGWDIARDIVQTGNGTGEVLDGLGPLHTYSP